MIKEKKEMIWRAFGPVWVQRFWNEINAIYKDGWCACENVGNMISDAPILRPNYVRVMFERDSVELTLEHLKTITSIDDYKELSDACGFKYEAKLAKTPMKFKKFIRESLERILKGDGVEETKVEPIVVEQTTAKAKTVKEIADKKPEVDTNTKTEVVNE